MRRSMLRVLVQIYVSDYRQVVRRRRHRLP